METLLQDTPEYHTLSQWEQVRARFLKRIPDNCPLYVQNSIKKLRLGFKDMSIDLLDQYVHYCHYLAAQHDIPSLTNQVGCDISQEKYFESLCKNIAWKILARDLQLNHMQFLSKISLTVGTPSEIFYSPRQQDLEEEDGGQGSLSEHWKSLKDIPYVEMSHLYTDTYPKQVVNGVEQSMNHPNADAFGIIRLSNGGFFAAVLDGSGAGRGPYRAAQLSLVLFLKKALKHTFTDTMNTVQFLVETFHQMHQTLVDDEIAASTTGVFMVCLPSAHEMVMHYLIAGDVELFLSRKNQMLNLSLAQPFPRTNVTVTPGGLGKGWAAMDGLLMQNSNLHVGCAYLQPGDTLIASSDGFGDNVDPILCNTPEQVLGKPIKDWDLLDKGFSHPYWTWLLHQYKARNVAQLFSLESKQDWPKIAHQYLLNQTQGERMLYASEEYKNASRSQKTAMFKIAKERAGTSRGFGKMDHCGMLFIST
ncbi:hypothetical protein EDD86DRAFT_219710 [Gorgonomyces haynaldii]|nr:hypothetical protein EDD86DRAFT_219710 [Gorgonomyces haynaldii]